MTDTAIFDFDNHYYESTDAFTRHQDKALRNRGVRWAEIDGRQRLLVGGRLSSYVANPTFDPVAKPGSLFDWYRGNPAQQTIVEAFGELEPIRPEYRDRDARLKVMDEQRIAGTLMFPTLGVGLEDTLRDDPEAAVGCFHAFNQWLDEDWGYAYEGRLFAVPYIQLLDPEAAAAELRDVLDRGAVAVNVRNAPVPGAGWLPLAVRPGVRRLLGPRRGVGRGRRHPRRQRRLRRPHPDVGAGRRRELAVPLAAAGRRHQEPGRQRLLRHRRLPPHLRALPGSAAGQRRERCVVDHRPAAPPRRRGQPQPRLLRPPPPRGVRRARVGDPLLGGRRRRPASTRSAPTDCSSAPTGPTPRAPASRWTS